MAAYKTKILLVGRLYDAGDIGCFNGCVCTAHASVYFLVLSKFIVPYRTVCVLGHTVLCAVIRVGIETRHRQCISWSCLLTAGFKIHYMNIGAPHTLVNQDERVNVHKHLYDTPNNSNNSISRCAQ